MKVSIKIYLPIFLACLINMVVMSQTFDIMTEQWPPFNFKEGNKIVGITVDIVREILVTLDHPDTIHIMPWARAYESIRREDNKILFSMGYSEERKDLFKWVGPIAEFRIAFYKRFGSDITITSMEDAKKVGRIGVTRDTMSHLILQKNNFTNIDVSHSGRSVFKKLLADRVDLVIATNTSIYPITMGQNGVSEKDVEEVYTVRKSDLYIAFSKSTPDEVIKKWQNALDDLKKSKKYDKIFKKYAIY